MERTKELICYFLANSLHPLNKTEIVKMLYLFEYYHVQTFGEQYTELTFIRYNYGPYAQAIEIALDDLMNDGLIKREIVEYTDRCIYLHTLCDTGKTYTDLLNEEKKLIADRVIGELSNKNYDDMIKHVYSTPPMRRILIKEERCGFTLVGEVLNMKESKPLRKFSKAKIEEARKRLDKSSRGSDEEYYAHLLAINEELKILRRRANSCILK